MNCHSGGNQNYLSSLSVSELSKGKAYWMRISESEIFTQELSILKHDAQVDPPSDSKFKFLRPFLDPSCVIRVSGYI